MKGFFCFQMGFSQIFHRPMSQSFIKDFQFVFIIQRIVSKIKCLVLRGISWVSGKGGKCFQGNDCILSASESKTDSNLLTPVVLSKQLHPHNGKYEDNDTQYEC
jgi:hypothetical protein